MVITKPKPGEPWWVPASIVFMDGVLSALGRVDIFEWGCGGSTLWLAPRSRELVSVEHSDEWIGKIGPKLPGHAKIVKQDKTSWLYEAVVADYKPYVVCVDGRRRVECIKKAIHRMGPGGYLLLDNSERQRYKPAIDLMKDWKQWHFSQGDDWRTSIWKKP